MFLSCNAPDGQKLRFELQPITRIGRDADNDIQLFDSSASGHHCEIRVIDGAITVHDVGSINGIFINGEPIQQAVLHAGSLLQIGDTEFLVEPEVEAATSEVAVPSSSENCRNHSEVVADWRCPKCSSLFCSACIADGRKFGAPRIKFCPLCSTKADDMKAERVAMEQQKKSARLLEPWKYPLRGEGLIILIAGALFLVLTSIVSRFAMGLGLLVFLFSTGYLLAYSQKIIASSAHGDFEPPTWPDFSDFTEDILPPFWHSLGLYILYFAPSFVARWFLPEGDLASAVVPAILLIGGIVLAPMAWLAVSMHDSITALSPHVAILSIMRIPFAYLAVSLQFFILIALNAALSWGLNHLQVPVLPWILGFFLGVYFLMVVSRLLGTLYYTHRARLNWF